MSPNEHEERRAAAGAATILGALTVTTARTDAGVFAVPYAARTAGSAMRRAQRDVSWRMLALMAG